jgi:hypothetical protein
MPFTKKGLVVECLPSKCEVLRSKNPDKVNVEQKDFPGPQDGEWD